MADYFTKFSVVLQLKGTAEQQYALDLARQAAAFRQEDKPVTPDFPAALLEVLEDWNFEIEPEKNGVWLHSENGGIDAVCAFIQHLLQKFDCRDRVTFEWSHDCTKPRTDAYGGGAAIITADHISTMSTADWLRTVAG